MISLVKSRQEEAVKEFTPLHELFVRKLISIGEDKAIDLYIELFKPKSHERQHLKRMINRILVHDRTREIVEEVQAQVNEELIKRTTITKEKLIHMFLRVHDKCMTDVPVTGMRGNQLKAINPYYDPEDESKGEKVIGIYQFKPQGAIKALENIKQLLGFDVKEVNINHKSTIIQQASEGLTQALPKADDKKELTEQQVNEIEEAKFSLDELNEEIKQDDQEMMKARTTANNNNQEEADNNE